MAEILTTITTNRAPQTAKPDINKCDELDLERLTYQTVLSAAHDVGSTAIYKAEPPMDFGTFLEIGN